MALGNFSYRKCEKCNGVEFKRTSTFLIEQGAKGSTIENHNTYAECIKCGHMVPYRDVVGCDSN